MAQRDKNGGSQAPGEAGFEGRDLLIGRPEPSAPDGKVDAGSGTPAPRASSERAEADDNLSREVLTGLAEIQAELKSLKATSESEHKAAGALARDVAALRQSVEEARGAPAEAAELAAGRDGEAAAAARVLSEGEAALTAQGEALDRRLEETDRRAETAARALDEMNEAAKGFAKRLGFLSDSISRELANRRRRRWMAGLALTAVAMAAFPLGALVQRETFFLTLGDPRHEWNAFVIERYAPLFAACASKAWTTRKDVNCVLTVNAFLPVAVPLAPNIGLADGPTEGLFNPETKR